MNSKQEYQKEYYKKQHNYLEAEENEYTKRIVERIVKTGKLNKKESILEIGSGKGRFTKVFLKKGLNISCLDISQDMVNELKKSVTGKVGYIKQGDITDKKLKLPKKFDAIVGVHILHHLTDLRAGLTNMKKWLKPRGRIIFTEPNPLNPLFYAHILIEKDMTWKGEKNILLMTKKNLITTLQCTGFTDIKVYRRGFLPPQIVNTKGGSKIEKIITKYIKNTPINLLSIVTAKKK